MTTAILTSDTLPERLTALGWKRSVRVRGVLGDGPAVAIVGARAASQIGMDRAHALAKHLAANGMRIVSGGALGIDGAAHRGALAGGGTTTVVLGGGLDRPYPQRHVPMFEQVLAHGGALVSMQPDDVEPRAGMFLTRNPLIAALADCVLVIEAELRSGSLSTARAATELGKVVAAWPGSRGCDRLIAAGAGVVEGPRDAENAAAGSPRRAAQMVLPVLDATATRVVEAIRGGARGVDAICASTGLAVRDVLRALPSIESSFLARKQ